MLIKDAVNFLLKEGYLTLIAGDITVTNKLKREYGTNLTIDLNKLSNDELYYKFVEDSDIPTFIEMSNGKRFRVKVKCEQTKRKLKLILKKINYDDLVQATKLYYKRVDTNRYTLKNYLITDIYEQEVIDYLQGNNKQTDGSNKFED